MQVPLDYRNPGGEQFEVAVSKLPAANSRDRRGALLLNPGGPALPGLDRPGAVAPTLPPSVLAVYDLIGFDPRGVGHSTPQSYGLDDPSLAGLFPYPAADGSITANVDHARADAERCATNAGKKLQYFTTANTARDMDRIRTALGEEKISYWGRSYGTYLGAVYESLFPERADRVVLEGNVDPTKVWAQATDNWGKAMSERFPDAARVAAAQQATLGLGGTVDEVTQKYLALADRLDRTPAPVPGSAWTKRWWRS
ncbi:alpha/beta fold hydrolase [Amycolatopsis sacchari]|uniref:alpha/beta fold hydrolase n=1 Tax=Amycolatopsis sacchari TaxID=115433 RepID=UPI003EBC5A0A